MNIPGSCIFCSSNGPFKRDEHPIPQALGSDVDEVLPRGFVCDPCNQYFGIKIENPLLSAPPFSIERTAAAIPTKKRRLPSHREKNLSLLSTGYWDQVIFASENLSRPPMLFRPDGTGFLVPSSFPDYDELLPRFLLKMGLELLTGTTTDVRASIFNAARQYARFDRCQGKWEFAYGLYPRRKELIISVREDELGPLQTRQIYQFEMGQMTDGRFVFCFVFITHVFAICLNDQRLGTYIGDFNRMNGFALKSSLV